MMNKNNKAKISIIIKRLKKKYKAEMNSSLYHSNPWELLVATILSAQSQDKQVNKITGPLFRKYKTIGAFANLKPQQLYPYVSSIGLYKNKSKNIIKTARTLKNNFDTKVPKTIIQLTSLDGVGRKTANVVLSNAFGINEGIAIDTHCITVANRLKLTNSKDPNKIEQKLMKIIDKKDWGVLTHLFIALGRDTCTAKVKYCNRCVLKNICPSSDTR